MSFFSKLGVAMILSATMFTVHAKDFITLSETEPPEIQKARQLAFKNSKPQLDPEKYAAVDPQYEENKKQSLTKRKFFRGNRSITYFEDGTYGVSDFDTFESLHYDPSGNLKTIIVKKFDRKDNIYFPNADLQYEYPSGQLKGIAYRLSPDEIYGFRPDGTLSTHCINDRCLDLTQKVRIDKFVFE